MGIRIADIYEHRLEDVALLGGVAMGIAAFSHWRFW